MRSFLPRSLAPPSRPRIGLFGGSFNPPHAGHRHASLVALRRAKLDAVWWLVTPGNPLKNASELASLERRVKAAEDVADDRRIKVTTLETALGTRFTADTLKALVKRFRDIQFVWIMGADNLATFHRWRDWRRIAALMPIVVVARPGYVMKALASPAARAFARSRLNETDAAALCRVAPPAWVFLDEKLVPLSSTSLRARGLWPGRGM